MQKHKSPVMINKIREIKPEKVFLIIGLVWGVAFLIITPPFQVPDENIHFYKSLSLTVGQVYPEKNGEVYGVYVPKSAVKSFEVFRSLLFNTENKIKFSNITSLINTPLNNDDNIFKNISLVGIVTYSPIPYLASVIFIFIGKLLNLSPIVLLYLGRLANLLLYVLIEISSD
jgi:uncharacterized membrane protein